MLNGARWYMKHVGIDIVSLVIDYIEVSLPLMIFLFLYRLHRTVEIIQGRG